MHAARIKTICFFFFLLFYEFKKQNTIQIKSWHFIQCLEILEDTIFYSYCKTEENMAHLLQRMTILLKCSK